MAGVRSVGKRVEKKTGTPADISKTAGEEDTDGTGSSLGALEMEGISGMSCAAMWWRR